MALKRRIRRKLRRKSPAVKRKAGARSSAAKSDLNEPSSLMIGGAHDPAEKAADHMAARVLSAPGLMPIGSNVGSSTNSAVHRKCASCQAEEKVSRKPAAGVVAPGTASSPASKSAAMAVGSLGGGRGLNRSEKAFFEPRFGREFSGVRIHEGAKADRASKAIDAKAFTKGNDVAFAKGQRTKSTMAHELAHVVQDGGATRRLVRRRLTIQDPAKPVPGSVAAKKPTTPSQVFQGYLNTLCSELRPIVNASGKVTISGKGKKKNKLLLTPRSPTACNCIATMVNTRKKWKVRIADFPAEDNPYVSAKHRRSGKGVVKSRGGLIVLPSPFNSRKFGTYDRSGNVVQAKLWEIVAHEMCGHAFLLTKGMHPRRSATKMRHGHDKVVEQANKIRSEIDPSRPMRGNSLKMPYCGESLLRDPKDKGWKVSSNIDQCVEIREAYLLRMSKKHPSEAKYSRNYPLKDQLP